MRQLNSVNSHGLQYLIKTLVFLLLILAGPLQYPDAQVFLSNNEHQFSIYGFYLKIHERIFGGYSHYSVIIVQLLLGLYAIESFCQYISRTYQLSAISFFIISITLLSPYCLFAAGNVILPEALSLPVFILMIKYLFQCISLGSIKHFVAFLGLSIILCLISKQYLFIYPAIFIFLIFLKKNSSKMPIFLTLLLSLFAVGIFEKQQFEMQNHFFQSDPQFENKLLSNLLYITNSDDCWSMSTDLEKKVCQNLSIRIAQGNLSHAAFTKSKSSHYINMSYAFYDERYPTILNQIIPATFEKFGMTSASLRETVTLKLCSHFLKNHFKKFTLLIINNVIFCIGGVVIITLMVFFIFLIYAYARHCDVYMLNCILFLLFDIFNYSWLAAVGPISLRSTIMTDIFVFCFFVIAGIKLFQEKKKQASSLIKIRNLMNEY